MRADRLISILLLLQNHGRMNSRELAEKLEVSERTIHRDMEALSVSGIPVFADRGTNGGWSLSEGYRTNLTGLKSEEIQSLLLTNTMGLLSDLGMRNDYDRAFQKLLASLPVNMLKDAEYVRQHIHIDGAGWHQSNETIPHLSAVQEAVWEERKLYIQYSREESVTERIVHPLGLVAKRSTWYMVAAVEAEIRTYRISRLLDARVQDESFLRPTPFDLAEYWEHSTERFKANLPRYFATMRLDTKLLPVIHQERYVKVLRTETIDHDRVEAHLEFNTLESACEIVLGFGQLAQVIAPAELRDKVITEAKAILAKYSSL